MATFQQRLHLIKDCLVGCLYKIAIDAHLLSIPVLDNYRKEGEKVIVSLTSYGRRVTSVVSYAIVSMLRQTVKPDCIVLYLDSWQWNDDNLPNSLKRLKKHGVEIRYTDKKLKSYKKLVHALEDFSNETIITVDDDMYYRKDMIERMLVAQKNDSTKVYSNYAHMITTDDNGEIAPYNSWIMDRRGARGSNVFLLGVASCIYRRELLHNDVINDKLYTELAPNADDIWFFFMEVIKGTQRESLEYSGSINYPLDFFYQLIHDNASLNASNCGQSQNDIQFKKVMEYYNLKDKDIL